MGAWEHDLLTGITNFFKTTFSKVFGSSAPAKEHVGLSAPDDAEREEALAAIGRDAIKTARTAPARSAQLATLQSPAEQVRAEDPKVTRIFITPKLKTTTSARFVMADSNGEELKPGEKWLFELPPDMRSSPIRTVTLAHRKAEKHRETVNKEGWDSQGAYNLVKARHAENHAEWIEWSDSFGSRKFAEPRSAGDPEHENLHDWLSIEKAAVDVVSVEGVGSGEHAIANVHSLEIEVYPKLSASARQEEIFTPGTVFVDPDKGIDEPEYGGGPAAHRSEEQLKESGLYPNSVVMASGQKRVISEECFLDGSGHLHVKLRPGFGIASFEMAIGDTYYDPSRPAKDQRNKDGHTGRLGWAKLSARVERDGKPLGSDFMVRLNVPPQGVLSGAPADAQYVAQAGDEIVARADGHTAWLMGYRVLYIDASGSSEDA